MVQLRAGHFFIRSYCASAASDGSSPGGAPRLDESTLHSMPVRLENFASNLVYNANGGDVTDVFVDGRQIVRDREVTTIDRREVFDQVQTRAERIWRVAEKNF